MKNISRNTSIIAAITLIIGLLIGFSLSNYNVLNINNFLDQNDSPVKSSSYEISDRDFETTGCDRSDCLFTSDDGLATAGYATIEGYYSQFETKDLNGKSIVCDAFVMTDGEEVLVDNFWYVDDEISAFGIFLDTLATSHRESILSSTIESQIEINIISQYRITGKGAPTCYSHEQIVGVSE